MDNSWGSEGPEVRVLSERWSTAAREHPCAHCHLTIGKGERFYRSVSIVDGRFEAACAHTRSAACLMVDDGAPLRVHSQADGEGPVLNKKGASC